MAATDSTLPGAGPRPPLVVLDTNVVVSALVFSSGTAGRFRHAWQQGRLVPLVSTRTATELLRVLAYPKFRLSVPEQQELLADYLPHTRSVPIPAPPPAVPICRDPADTPFLVLAKVGRAAALVTGDRALLEVGKVGRCPILAPEAFLASQRFGPVLTQT